MNEIEGFVLNGGRSSRMGTPKGALRIGELTLAKRAAEALGAVCGTVYLVGGETGVDGIEILPDLAWHGSNGKASILGLRSALLHCSTRYTAVLACDMPFVTGEVFSRLEAEIEKDAGYADVSLPSDRNKRLQPLCAIYKRDNCTRTIEAYLETGELSVRGFVSRLRSQVLDASRFAGIRHEEHLFMNVNTPEDIAEAAKILS